MPPLKSFSSNLGSENNWIPIFFKVLGSAKVLWGSIRPTADSNAEDWRKWRLFIDLNRSLLAKLMNSVAKKFRNRRGREESQSRYKESRDHAALISWPPLAFSMRSLRFLLFIKSVLFQKTFLYPNR